MSDQHSDAERTPYYLRASILQTLFVMQAQRFFDSKDIDIGVSAREKRRPLGHLWLTD
jgi:hypothetical protein